MSLAIDLHVLFVFVAKEAECFVGKVVLKIDLYRLTLGLGELNV